MQTQHWFFSQPKNKKVSAAKKSLLHFWCNDIAQTLQGLLSGSVLIWLRLLFVDRDRWDHALVNHFLVNVSFVRCSNNNRMFGFLVLVKTLKSFEHQSDWLKTCQMVKNFVFIQVPTLIEMQSRQLINIRSSDGKVLDYKSYIVP